MLVKLAFFYLHSLVFVEFPFLAIFKDFWFVTWKGCEGVQDRGTRREGCVSIGKYGELKRNFVFDYLQHPVSDKKR